MSALLEGVVAAREGRDWCLFLDRDGVINRRVPDGYVRRPRELVLLPGTIAALRILRSWAPRLVIVTNQQGIGKGVMDEDDLRRIHRRLSRSAAIAGVGFDGIVHCPHRVSERCPCRKPRPGMALDWLADHPEVDASLSVMIGDSASDIEMAHRLRAATGGCVSFRIEGGAGGHDPGRFASLLDLAAALESARRRMTFTW